MPAPAHFRITFSGILGTISTPVEEWSFGLSLDASEGIGDVIPAGTATLLRTKYTTSIAPMLPSDVQLTRTRIAAINDVGRVYVDASGAYQQQDDTTQVNGGGTARQLPASACLVASLMTTRAGATGRGRVFLPFPAMNIDQITKNIIASDAQIVATNMRGFIDSINTMTGFGPVSVVSSKGYASKVTRVRVGRRPDVLRSRSRRQLESYELSSAVA